MGGSEEDVGAIVRYQVGNNYVEVLRTGDINSDRLVAMCPVSSEPQKKSIWQRLKEYCLLK